MIWRLLLLIITFCLAPTGLAQHPSLQDLIDADKLRISSELDPAGDIVPGQKSLLRLTIATDRWFAGGTRIRVPEIPGVIALQTEVFARNSSERRDGKSWVVQQWILDLYPTREGSVSSGPINISLSINTEGGVVSGSVEAPAVTITASKPAALNASEWLAAPAFSARQQFSPAATELAPGDAITRSITLEASDVLDKMLPEVATHQFEGLSAYPHSPVLESRSNRGQSQVSRVQEITYIAEQAGNYQLPSYRFAWWDTNAQELKWVTLEGFSFTVTGVVPNQGVANADAFDWSGVLQTAGLLCIVLLLLWVAHHWLPGRRLKTWASAAQTRWQRWRAPALPPTLNRWRSKRH